MSYWESSGASDEWYTPAFVFDALGVTFDLDVASAESVVHVPCRSRLTSHGLQTMWRGFVWMNPPFGGRNGLVPWLDKFFDHGNGIALTPDRTSAPWWQATPWPVTLPANPRRDLTWSPKGNVIAFGTEVGKGKRRRRSTYRSKLWSLSFIMTEDQLADFIAFFEGDLEDGALPFEWVYPRTGDTWEFTFAADNPYTVAYFTPLEQLVTLSLDGEVLP